VPAITPEISVSRLSPAWEAMALPLVNARSPRPEEIDGPALLAAARANAARFPDDSLALTALGRNEKQSGDAGAAEVALTRAVEMDPTNVEALLLLAGVVRERADLATDEATITREQETALALLRRAIEADPRDYRAYAALARLRRSMTHEPTEEDLMIWAMAARYAPQVMSIRGDAAVAMLRDDRLDEAEALLIPVASDPHGGPGVQQARFLLAQVQALKAGKTED